MTKDLDHFLDIKQFAKVLLAMYFQGLFASWLTLSKNQNEWIIIKFLNGYGLATGQTSKITFQKKIPNSQKHLLIEVCMLLVLSTLIC